MHGAEAELRWFYVIPDAPGSGVAVALLQALVEYARGYCVGGAAAGDRRQAHAAIRVYHMHGFTEVPRFGRYVDSVTFVCMQQVLPAARSSRSQQVTVVPSVWTLPR